MAYADVFSFDEFDVLLDTNTFLNEDYMLPETVNALHNDGSLRPLSKLPDKFSTRKNGFSRQADQDTEFVDPTSTFLDLESLNHAEDETTFDSAWNSDALSQSVQSPSLDSLGMCDTSEESRDSYISDDDDILTVSSLIAILEKQEKDAEGKKSSQPSVFEKEDRHTDDISHLDTMLRRARTSGKMSSSFTLSPEVSNIPSSFAPVPITRAASFSHSEPEAKSPPHPHLRRRGKLTPSSAIKHDTTPVKHDQVKRSRTQWTLRAGSPSLEMINDETSRESTCSSGSSFSDMNTTTKKYTFVVGSTDGRVKPRAAKRIAFGDGPQLVRATSAPVFNSVCSHAPSKTTITQAAMQVSTEMAKITIDSKSTAPVTRGRQGRPKLRSKIAKEQKQALSLSVGRPFASVVTARPPLALTMGLAAMRESGKENSEAQKSLNIKQTPRIDVPSAPTDLEVRQTSPESPLFSLKEINERINAAPGIAMQ